MADKDTEAGFSLVELAVVVFVLAILIAVAAGTFLHSTGRSSDAAAQSRARQGALTQKVHYSDSGSWGTAAQIQGDEPSIHFADLDPSVPKVLGKVYVKVDGDVATLVSR